jgi:hypothetical protein
MTEHSDLIERYLDELLAGLRGDAASVRRMLTEAEEHLYADRQAGIARGLSERDASQAAVDHFGSPVQVARAWSLEACPPRPVWRSLPAQFAPLAGVGLVAIGLSGLLARVMTSLWGTTFMFADPPGTTYSNADCRYWESIHPHANSCTNAYLAESLSDGLHARYAAGLLGLVLLGVIAVRQHHRRGPMIATTPATVSLTGAIVFLCAAVALAALAADAFRVADDHGAGQWLSGAIVALPVATAYSFAFLRSNRRTAPNT